LGDFLTLRMNDWAASLIAAALFAFLSPGLVFQMPGNDPLISWIWRRV
jgi:hypothetical protein